MPIPTPNPTHCPTQYSHYSASASSSSSCCFCLCQHYTTYARSSALRLSFPFFPIIISSVSPHVCPTHTKTQLAHPPPPLAPRRGEAPLLQSRPSLHSSHSALTERQKGLGDGDKGRMITNASSSYSLPSSSQKSPSPSSSSPLPSSPISSSTSSTSSTMKSAGEALTLGKLSSAVPQIFSHNLS